MEEKTEEIKKIKMEIYKPRFKKIKANKLKEDSNIHLPNGKVLSGKEGQYYIILDGHTDLILNEEIFKKLFILK